MWPKLERVAEAYECGGCRRLYATREGAEECCETTLIAGDFWVCPWCGEVHRTQTDAWACCGDDE